MTALSSDRPGSNPQDDLFVQAPFAESLAISIYRYPGNEGLVLALYGPWGPAKSTASNYVRDYLEQRLEAIQPAIVIFNPWRFSDQGNLLSAFLGRLQAVLPTKSEKFKKLGNFVEYVGELVDHSSVTGRSWSAEWQR